MRRAETVVTLSQEERQELGGVVRARTALCGAVRRARVVLLAAEGTANKAIAQEVGLSRARVVDWRQRFGRERMAGLQDVPRTGRPKRYDERTERRILAQLDEPPPAGRSSWNGPLVAAALGDVSVQQVWRVLRKHGVQLQRRRSWCISTDPEFTEKAADIVALYLHPPENAIVLSVDEKPAIRALERAQGWLRLPNGEAVRGFSHEYKRHGTPTLFTALEVATGLAHVGHYRRRRRREFLDFINRLVGRYPDRVLHVILDNLSTHKPKHDRWLARHAHVHFHYTPTHASWLNQIEVWLSILSRQALRGLSATSIQEVCKAIDAFTNARNIDPMPFEWTKDVVYPSAPKHTYRQLRK